LGSTLCEDIQEFGKLTQIMTTMSASPAKKMDMGQLGFGTAAATVNGSYFLADQHDAQTIPASGSKRVHMKFDLSGLFSQHRWIPLYALGGQGLQIQWTLAPAVQAMIISNAGTTYSQNYTLSDIKLPAMMKSLSGELQESYTAALLNATSLKMPIKSWEVLTNYLPADSAGSFDIAMSKNYTRMASLFCCWNQLDPADNGGKAKRVNTNYFPTANAETASWHLALGSQRIPDNDCVGVSETWYRTQVAVGMYNSLAHSTGVDEASYKSDTHLLGIDCERLNSVMASGIDLSGGQTTFLKCTGDGSTSADVPRIATVFAHFENVISIQDTVVEVFE